MTVYDPPAGWRYGYPQKEIDWGGAEHVRFWETEEKEIA